MFSVGESYDAFMGRWSRQLAPLLVQFADVRDGDDVLDVGTGTGALAGAAAKGAPSGRVVGIDPSLSYVAVARAHAEDDRIHFAVGDARQLPFADAGFDRTLSLLILNFVSTPEKAVAEMMRVTRPGGTVAAAVWDYGAGMEMLRVFWDAAVALSPDAAARDERHMPLSRSGELAQLWRSQHLEHVSETALAIQTRFSSFDDYWTPFLEHQGPAGAYVGALSAPAANQLRLALRQRLAGEGLDRPVVLGARAWAVRGTVP